MSHNQFHIELGNVGQNSVTKKGTKPSSQKTVKISELLDRNKNTVINTPTEPTTYRYDIMEIVPSAKYKGKLEIKNSNGDLQLIDMSDAKNLELAGYAGLGLFAANSFTLGTGKAASFTTNTIFASRFTLAAAQSKLEGDSYGAAFLAGGLNTFLKPSFTAYHTGISATAEHALKHQKQKLLDAAANSTGIKKDLLNAGGKAINGWLKIGKTFHKLDVVNESLGVKGAINLGQSGIEFTPYSLNFGYLLEKNALKYGLPYVTKKIYNIGMSQSVYDEKYYGEEMLQLKTYANNQILGQTTGIDGLQPGQLEMINRIRKSQIESSGLGGQGVGASSVILNRIEPARRDNTYVSPLMYSTHIEPDLKQLFDKFEKNAKPKNKWIERFERIIIPEKYVAYDKIKKELKYRSQSSGDKALGFITEALIGDLVKATNQILSGRQYAKILAQGLDQNDVIKKQLAQFIVAIREAGGDAKFNKFEILITPPKEKKEEVNLNKQNPYNTVLSDNTRNNKLLQPISVANTWAYVNNVKQVENELVMASISATSGNEKEKEQIRKWAIEKSGTASRGGYMFTDDAVAKSAGFKDYTSLRAYYLTEIDTSWRNNIQGPTISQGRGTGR